MDSPYASLDFERFVYRQGQLLASRDFRDQQRMEAARRWMHNSALHSTWGVVSGYEVSLSGSSAPNVWEAGETLHVTPGIAYDCFGRELRLPKADLLRRDAFEDESGRLREDLVGKTFVLVLGYQEQHVNAGEIECSSFSERFKSPLPRLGWQTKNSVCYGLDVPLASVSFATGGRASRTIRASVQRFAVNRLRPLARPKIASGQTTPRQTAWRQWEVPSLSFSSPPSADQLGLEVEIDTSSAGFQRRPCYFAWLNGPLEVTVGGATVMFNPFVSLKNESLNRFTFRVFLLQHLSPAQANEAPWTVCWLGIESSR